MAIHPPMREIALVFLLIAAATVGLAQLAGVSALGDQVPLLIGALFFFTAVVLARREEGGLERFGVDLAGLLSPPDDNQPAGPLGLFDLSRAIRRALPFALREALVAVAVAAVVFAPYAAGFWLWHRPADPFEWAPPPDLFGLVVAQLVVIALPEEALFRGYFQTRLTDLWPRERVVLGARLSIPALVAQAVLFALLHFLVDLSPERIAVFFPGLLFGWLRALRGGIGAALVLHALSNVYSEILVRGFF